MENGETLVMPMSARPGEGFVESWVMKIFEWPQDERVERSTVYILEELNIIAVGLGKAPLSQQDVESVLEALLVRGRIVRITRYQGNIRGDILKKEVAWSVCPP